MPSFPVRNYRNFQKKLKQPEIRLVRKFHQKSQKDIQTLSELKDLWSNMVCKTVLVYFVKRRSISFIDPIWHVALPPQKKTQSAVLTWFLTFV